MSTKVLNKWRHKSAGFLSGRTNTTAVLYVAYVIKPRSAAARVACIYSIYLGYATGHTIAQEQSRYGQRESIVASKWCQATCPLTRWWLIFASHEPKDNNNNTSEWKFLVHYTTLTGACLMRNISDFKLSVKQYWWQTGGLHLTSLHLVPTLTELGGKP